MIPHQEIHEHSARGLKYYMKSLFIEIKYEKILQQTENAILFLINGNKEWFSNNSIKAPVNILEKKILITKKLYNRKKYEIEPLLELKETTKKILKTYTVNILEIKKIKKQIRDTTRSINKNQLSYLNTEYNSKIFNTY